MAQPLVILGTGGNALDILDVIEAINRVTPTWDLIGFLDDSRAVGSRFETGAILGGLRDATQHTGCLFINAIGSDKSYRKRPDILAQTRLNREQFATLVHPLSAISPRAMIGPGTCVNPGVVVAGKVEIGAHVWLGSGCVIGHDTVIEDCVMIAPRAVLSGSVRVGLSAYIGAGASVRQRVTIGERALVGLGSVVIADVAPATTVVGNPARILVRIARQGTKTGNTPPPQPGLDETPGPQPGLSDKSTRRGNE
ncbi:MAG: acetyltransferase [Planctomycetia bacterium]|nr:acetyltransferase [Planctomycetia bacterium]